jgi:hypothetical protein
LRYEKKVFRILGVKPSRGILPFIFNDCIQALSELSQEIGVVDPFKREEGGPKIQQGKLGKAISSFKPDLLFAINFEGIFPEVINTNEETCVSWFVDNPLYGDYTKIEGVSRERCIIFVLDRSYLGFFQELGFGKTFHLPLATNPKYFRRLSISATERKRYVCNVGFVGTSGYLDCKRTT